MTNAELIQKIRAEIERLHAEHSSRYGTDEAGLVLENLEDFLSTLESEKPMQEGLEEEMEKFIETFGWGKTKHLAEKELISATARHFAEWGAEHLKK